MNKKKVKILVSVASLVLVVAVMAVGVWAATQVSVASTVNVGFTASGISGTVEAYYVGQTTTVLDHIATSPEATIVGTAGETGNDANISRTATTRGIDENSAVEIASFDLATTNASTQNATFSFNFNDTNDNGFADEAVSIVFIFTNTSGGANDTNITYYVNLAATADQGDNYTVSFKYGASAAAALTGSTFGVANGSATAVTTSAPLYVVATFTPNANTSTTFTGDESSFTFNLTKTQVTTTP